VGPLIAWRKSSLASLKKSFTLPAIVGLAVMAALLAAGIFKIAPVMSFGLCAFVLASIASEFWKGSRAIQAKEKINLLKSVYELTWRNTRRYGGYLVHMGIVIMFVGFTGSAFNQHETVQMGLNQSLPFAGFGFKLLGVNDGDTPNYQFSHASVEVSKNGTPLTTLETEVRSYKASQEQSSIIGIRRRPNEDVYINFAGLSQDNSKAIFQLYVFPLVTLIWGSFYIILLGTIICLIPGKVRLQYARTEVVGISDAQPATIQH
jgi:cytochrome c-type biogenesis protein CcmF